MSVTAEERLTAPDGFAAPLAATPRRRAMLRRLTRRPSTLGALILVAIIVAAALLAPFLAPQNPYDLAALSVLDNRLAPGEQGGSGMTHWLGTDAQGRDMLSAILYGLRTSLLVGLLSTTLALAIGVTVGLIAAQYGRVLETVLMRIVDFILSFPTILVALVLLATMGRGVDKVIIAIVTVQWAQYARLMRGSALVERRKEYVEAAENLGIPGWRIMIAHLLPNSIGAVLVVGSIQIASAITLEATLSFLGVGVPVTQPSLGLLIANGFEFLLSGEYWIAAFPGIALVLLVFSLNLIGDRLRESLDARRT